MASETLDSLLNEKRVFTPAKDFSQQAHIHNLEERKALSEAARKNPEAFWSKQAESLHWFKQWETVLDWNPPDAKWFSGGEINVSYNCLDKHLKTRGDKMAILWEGEPGDKRAITYQELHKEVSRFAQSLVNLGLNKGDRAILYMPMIPELAIAMLACARIGVVHSIIFGGFSSTAIRDRVHDSSAKLVITADGGWRRGKIVPLKKNVDDALEAPSSVEKVIVFKRTKSEVSWNASRDVWWHELMAKTDKLADALPLDSEDPLFLLYTSGTTGKPKGILHTQAGYLLQATLSAKWVFDLKEEDIYFCTADIGWVTGHSYVVYGILANGATTLMYEGAPNHPHAGRFWEIVDHYKATIFYTAPTAIRAFMQWGDNIPQKYNLSSLRLLGTVGEPINPEAWMWYHTHIGKERCPIVDTWWQTETGAIMIAPLPGAVPTKPGSATLPLPGIEADVVDEKGNPVEANKGGFLVIKKPWPSMLRTIYNDHDQYVSQYWSRFKDMYWSGDNARRDEDGYFWLMGRADDVLNVAGHRLGSAEVESALVSHPLVAEAAVVGIPHEIKGEAVAAFVVLISGTNSSEALVSDLKKHVTQEIGAIARPEKLEIVKGLPKTRSGKIMRRLLRQMASGKKVTGDTTTLEDSTTLQETTPRSN